MSSAAATRSPRRRRPGWVDSFLLAVRIAAIVLLIWGIAGTVVKGINGEGPTGEAWRDLVVAGIAQGAMYGLIALGYSMVYGVLGFINFAHGEVFMVGAMTGMITSNKLADAGLWESNFIGSLVFIVVVSIIVSSLTAVVMERVAYRPLRGAPRLIPLITSIGVSFFLQNASVVLLGPASKSYPNVPDWVKAKHTFLQIEGAKILVIVVAALSMAALWYYVDRTKTGKAMRAVAEDAEIAALMGIDVNRTIVKVFAVGGAMAGMAGILWGILFRSVIHTTGFLPGIKAFSAAVVGGIGHLGGAMAGGLSIGVAESVGPLLILEPLGVSGVSQLRDAVAFSMLIIVLLVRPAGLFGERLPAEDRA